MTETLLKIDEVIARTTLSRSAVYARVSAGTFPKPIKLGEGTRAARWLAREIDDWIQTQVENRDDGNSDQQAQAAR